MLARGRFVWGVLFSVVVGCSLALRLPRLSERPMHGDEANQAVRTGLLLETGTYHYDPTDHHGPVLYFAAWPICRLATSHFAETHEWHYRLVPVCFSVLTLLLMQGLVGRNRLFSTHTGVLMATLFTALSPAMVYYSRFFIQETMFVTFLTGMLLCAVRYVSSRFGDAQNAKSPVTEGAWAVGFGAFAGLALATKETVVLSFAAAAVATVLACGWRRLWRVWRTRDVLLALASAGVVASVLFSSFFTYPHGVYDAIFSTVSAYLKRATAVPEHQHPWSFYLKILFCFKYGRGPLWSEAGLLMPALFALVTAFRPLRVKAAVDGATSCHRRWVRFLVFYTLVLTLLYSAIPYKTPWCALSFLHGYILLAGVGIGAAVGWLQKRTVMCQVAGWGVLVLFIGGLAYRHGAQACRACFKWPADPRNPYVYAHTGTDAMNLVAAIEKAAAAAAGYDTLIAIAVPTPDTWPLPWYLRAYKHVGYWTHVDQIPENLEPVIVIAAADQGDFANQRFGKDKQANFFGIRPGVLLNLFVPKQKKETRPSEL